MTGADANSGAGSTFALTVSATAASRPEVSFAVTTTVGISSVSLMGVTTHEVPSAEGAMVTYFSSLGLMLQVTFACEV